MKIFYELVKAVKLSFRNILPIIFLVIFFQAFIIRAVPDKPISIILGIASVVIGSGIFVYGLELSLLPLGKSLSKELIKKRSLALLLGFGFFLGFAAVIAEPALVSVAQKAESSSNGAINAFKLRLLIAVSVGLTVAAGFIRSIFSHPLHWYVIPGYITAVILSFFAPKEIIGLAFDTGGVTTNVVTVPLITVAGLGVVSSVKGKISLTDGFGIIALIFMVPMIAVQAYGILFGNFENVNQVTEEVQLTVPEKSNIFIETINNFFTVVIDLLPILAVIFIFQFLFIRKNIKRAGEVIFGLSLLALGLFLLVSGLEAGLFPLGESIAYQLISEEKFFFIYLFSFLLGFSVTMAEPALLNVAEQVMETSGGKINDTLLRLVVALGVGTGTLVGVFRIVNGYSLNIFLALLYLSIIVCTFFASKKIVPVAFDLGAVTASIITVPMVTALGIGLAGNIEGRNVLLDGFGLVAFASSLPIFTVMIYGIILDIIDKEKENESL